jgi:uncharacterized pyridoxal phosphate-containing UPF0001 family protein
LKRAISLLNSNDIKLLQNIKIIGLMGMATNTENTSTIRDEFTSLSHFYQKVKQEIKLSQCNFTTLSMGMSGDYPIAIACGSNMVRIGSSIFGHR